MFKPLLAVNADLAKLALPLYASPKLDGIRATVLDGRLVSRKLKPIPNDHIRHTIEALKLNGLDGEIITYTDGVMDPFHTVSSKVMSSDGEPVFKFHVFDDHTYPAVPFEDRLQVLSEKVGQATHAVHCLGAHDRRDCTCGVSALTIVPQLFIRLAATLDKYEAECLEQGFEGVMVRKPSGRYKFGRSTVNEAILLKVKRFEDDEAVIIGAEEEMTNTNTATTGNLGQTERSSHKAGLVGKGTLGALICRRADGLEFKIGTGFDAATRRTMWEFHLKGALVGLLAKYKHQPSGAKEAPRFPVFLGLRSADDL